MPFHFSIQRWEVAFWHCFIIVSNYRQREAYPQTQAGHAIVNTIQIIPTYTALLYTYSDTAGKAVRAVGLLAGWLRARV